MCSIRNFWQDHGFGNVEFHNTRLLDTALYDILEILQTPEKFVVAGDNSGRTLLNIGGGIFLVRYDDMIGFETAKTEFPQETNILKDSSILPRYFGEFEKDGVHYIIIDCDEKLSPKEPENNWISGTYRNMIYDLRTDSEKTSYGVKLQVKSVF